MPTLSSTKIDLSQLDKKYSEALKNVFFVGEIILSEEELISLCSLIYQNYDKVKVNFYNNALLVAAVNLAYFYYDDEGYWVHFNDICRLILHDIGNDSVGKKIEGALSRKDLLYHERKGPFRYVGAILEQTGITRRNIPRFAQIFKDAELHYGLKKLAEIFYKDYSIFIEGQYCSKFFKQYLLDEAGWNFTKQVAGILYYVKNEGLNVDELPTIRGFHPDFWVLFFNNYIIPKERMKNKNHNDFVRPGLFFDIKTLTVYLKLPSTQYSLDNYNGLNIDDKFRIQLHRKDDFRDVYYGKYLSMTGQEIHWSIRGWDSTTDKVAYFHNTSGYLKDPEKLATGRYYVLSEISNDSLLGQITQKFEKTFKVEDKEYDVFEVTIDSTNCVSEKKIPRVTLEWTRSGDLPMVNSFYNIFFDQFPTIKIENEYLLESGEAIIFYDVGDGIKKLKDYKNLTDFKKEYSSKAIIKGYLWTESLIRSGFGGKDDERKLLNFCIIPRFKVQFPLSVYSMDDEIKFNCVSDYIKFPDLTGGNKGSEWVIPKNINLLSGLVYDTKCQIEFTLPIRRADVILLSDPKRKFININNEDDNETINFKGLPNEKFTPAVKTSRGTFPIEEDVVFDDTGEFRISIRRVKQFCKSNSIYVGEFLLTCTRKTFELNKGVFNIANCSINSKGFKLLEEEIETISKFAPEVVLRINHLSSVLNAESNAIKYLGRGSRIKEIDDFYDTVIGLAFYLDGCMIMNGNSTQVEVTEEYIKIKEFEEIIRWRIRVKKALKINDQSALLTLVSEYEKLEKTCLINRWEEKLKSLYHSVVRVTNPRDVLNDWCKEIMDQKLYGYKNEISMSEGGKYLSQAWVYYLKKNYDKALVLLERLESESHPLVKRLRTLLLCIIYLKFGRFAALEHLVNNYNYGTEEIDDLIDNYKGVYQVIVLGKNQIDSKITYVSTINIPLLDDDKILIGFLKREGHKNKLETLIKVTREADNWVITLFVLKYLKNINVTNKELRLELKMQEDRIPKFPQWEEYIEDLTAEK